MVEISAREVETFETRDGKQIYDLEDQEKQSHKITFLQCLKDKKLSEASEVLVRYIDNHLKIYTTKDDKQSEMWVYKNGIYVPNGKSEIKERLREMLGTAFSMYYYHQAIAKIEADTYIETDEFFKNRYVYLIPVQNGILNLKTKELMPFNPDMIFFNKLPIRYDKKAQCIQIEQFLGDVLPDKEDINVIYEIGGFALINEYTFEKAFMFVGDGRNGKDKTLELFKRVIGIENCASVPLHSLTPDSFSLSELLHKKINLAGEIDNKDLKDTTMFKACTGRSLISGKRKFMRDIIFENYAKFVFACNELPMVYDLNRGFWDRWVLVEFPFYFADRETYKNTPEKDKTNWKIRDEDIINKITTEEELSGLLNKFIEGLDRLLKNRKFSSTKSTEEVKDTWIRKSNSFIAFCYENIEENSEGKISKKDLRKRYAKYCKKHKIATKSDVVIKNFLQSAYGASEDRINVGLNTYEFERFWVGVKWKNG